MSDENTTTMDPRQPLRNMVEGYTGKKPDDSLDKAGLRALLRTAPEYAKAFAQRKEEVMALEDLAVRVQHNVDVPAWLIDGNAELRAKGSKRGDAPKAKGANFLLPSGYDKFVNWGGPMPSPPPVLTEYVFTGATVTTDYSSHPPRRSYDTRGLKPIQKAHGVTPPRSDVSEPLAFAWSFNQDKGHVRGEARVGLAMLQITSEEGDIAFFPPGDFSDEPTLRYTAIDSDGTSLEVHDDPLNAATQLGIPVDSPARLWKTKLAGRQIACSGTVEVLTYAGDKAFGEGVLAKFAAENQAHLVPGDAAKDPLKNTLSFKHLYDAKASPSPCIMLGEKMVYQLESYSGRPASPGAPPPQVWKAMVPLHRETDKQGRPMPPRLWCFEAVIEKRAGGTFTKREGAWLSYLGAAKASEASRQMFLD